MRNNTFLQSSRQLKKKHNSIKLIDFHFEEEIDDANPKRNLSISAMPMKNTSVNIIDKFRKKPFENNSLSSFGNVFMKPQPYLKDVELYMANNSTKYPQTAFEQIAQNQSLSITEEFTLKKLSTFANLANDFNENISKEANEAFHETSTDNVSLHSKFNDDDDEEDEDEDDDDDDDDKTAVQNEILAESNFSDMNLVTRSDGSQLNNSQDNLALQKWIEFEISQRSQQNGTVVLEEIALNNTSSLAEVLKSLLSHNQTLQNNFITDILNNSSAVNTLTLASTVATKQQELPLADAVFLSSDSNDIINGKKKLKNNEKKMAFERKTDIDKKETYKENELKRRKNVTAKHKTNVTANKSTMNNGMEILTSKPELLFVCLLKLSALILF
ncbi:myb-like protein O [Octopus bimaculoides]|nr:myb-like protein O [Octopus bimaculoides]